MRLEKISIGRLALLITIFVMAADQAVAQTSSPELLVLLRAENALGIIDPVAGKVVGRVPKGESPHEVTVSDDGKLAFVSNYGRSGNIGRTISVIDVAARKELRRVDIGPLSRPHDVLYAGGKLYFTAEGYKVIGRYDPAEDKIDWLIGTGQNRTHMLVLSKDKNTIFAPNITSNSISIIEGIAAGPPDWNVSVVPVGKWPEGIDVTPDGKELWVATYGDGAVSIIDIATKKVTQTLNLNTKDANRLKFTPDGRRVLLSDAEGGELIILDAIARKEIKRIPIAPSAILITSDGSRAYAALGKDNSVAVVDLRTLEVTSRIPTGMGSNLGCIAFPGIR